MINIKNLFKSFSLKKWDNLAIYKNLSLNIKMWEFISIIGTSWSWKTTFLNLISWLDDFEEWNMTIADNILEEMSTEEKTQFRWQNISFIFQNFNLIDNLSVEENVDLIIDLNKLERRYTTSEILKIVWLKDKSSEYPYNLSGGEQQRVAVARAFVGATPILLADEPTGNLDIKNSKIITSLIQKLHQESNNTIIMITHDNNIAQIADKIYCVENYTLKLLGS